MTGDALERPASAPVAPVDPEAAPLVIPPHVVAAIARAAVEAYKEAERQRKNAAWRAYARVNRDRINETRRAKRQQRRLEQLQFPVRRAAS